MADKEFDYFFMKREPSSDLTEFNKTVEITKDYFMKTATSVSKRILKDMEDEMKKKGNECSPVLFMSEVLTHAVLLGELTKELFGEEE